MDVVVHVDTIDVYLPRPIEATAIGLFLAEGLDMRENGNLNRDGMLLEGGSLFCTHYAVFWVCLDQLVQNASSGRHSTSNVTHTHVSLPQPEWRGSYIVRLTSVDCILGALSSPPFLAGPEMNSSEPRIEVFNASAGRTGVVQANDSSVPRCAENPQLWTCPLFTVRVSGRGLSAHANDSVALLPVSATSVDGKWRRQLLPYLRVRAGSDRMLGSTQPTASLLVPIPIVRDTYVAVLIRGGAADEMTEDATRILAISEVFVVGGLEAFTIMPRGYGNAGGVQVSFRVQPSTPQSSLPVTYGAWPAVNITPFLVHEANSSAPSDHSSSQRLRGGLRGGLIELDWVYRLLALQHYWQQDQDSVFNLWTSNSLTSVCSGLYQLISVASAHGVIDGSTFARVTAQFAQYLQMGRGPSNDLSSPTTLQVPRYGSWSILAYRYQSRAHGSFASQALVASPSFVVLRSSPTCQAILPSAPLPPRLHPSGPMPAADDGPGVWFAIAVAATAAAAALVGMLLLVRLRWRWKRGERQKNSNQTRTDGESHTYMASLEATPSATPGHSAAFAASSCVELKASSTSSVSGEPIAVDHACARSSPVCGVTADSLEVEWDSLLGKGGMASVYVGQWLGTAVAVKVLKAGPSEPSYDLAKSLRAEAGVLEKLRHPCICSFFGTTLLSCGDEAIVLEYLKAGTLFGLLHCGRTEQAEMSELTAKWHGMIHPPDASDHASEVILTPADLPAVALAEHSEWRLSTPLACRIARETASGLAFLHANGYMHRDVRTIALSTPLAPRPLAHDEPCQQA